MPVASICSIQRVAASISCWCGRSLPSYTAEQVAVAKVKQVATVMEAIGRIAAAHRSFSHIYHLPQTACRN